MRGISSIPLIDSLNYPVDIYVRIRRSGSQYYLEIHTLGQVLPPAPIDISPDDLVSLNADLQSALEDIANSRADGDTCSSAESAKQLRALAELGHYAFTRFFGDSEAMSLIQNLLAFDRTLSIQVASEDFSLPWELMYPASLGQTSTYDEFIGVKHIVSRVIVQRQRPGAFVLPTIQVPFRPRLGLFALICEELPAVGEKEIPFFEKLAEAGKIALLRLRALEAGRREHELKEFITFWRNEFDIAHLACHGSFEISSPIHSYIRISDDFPVTLKDLAVYKLDIAGHPLIVMNACQTGKLNPLYTSSFAAAFLRYGALGVVAAEGFVKDSFAAEFTEQLYRRLLAGECLGNSLLDCRRHFLSLRDDPSGLLYSMYAPPTVRFQIGAPSG